MLMLAQEHPEQAAALLPASDFTATGASPAAEQVLQTWVAKSPLDAVAWATRLPAGEARTAGYKVVFSQWLNADSQTALSWVGSQTNPQVRREVIGTLIGNLIAYTRPDPQLPARARISKSPRRNRTRNRRGHSPSADAEPTPEPEQEIPADPQPEPVPEPQSQPPLDSSPGQEIEPDPALESGSEPAEEAEK